MIDFSEKYGVDVMEKKYLVTWFDNAWHNGTFYGKNARDIVHQCMNIGIKPKKIELLEE